MAIETDFGAELKAQAFAIDSEAFGQPSDTDTGWANYLRLKADFKDKNTGVSVHTSIELAGSRWRGDNRGTVVSPGATGQYNPSSGGDTARLDLGYVQVPFANGTILRVGRQLEQLFPGLRRPSRPDPKHNPDRCGLAGSNL